MEAEKTEESNNPIRDAEETRLAREAFVLLLARPDKIWGPYEPDEFLHAAHVARKIAKAAMEMV